MVLDPGAEQWLHLQEATNECQLTRKHWNLEAIDGVVKEALKLRGVGVEHHQVVCSCPAINTIFTEDSSVNWAPVIVLLFIIFRAKSYP